MFHGFENPIVGSHGNNAMMDRHVVVNYCVGKEIKELGYLSRGFPKQEVETNCGFVLATNEQTKIMIRKTVSWIEGSRPLRNRLSDWPASILIVSVNICPIDQSLATDFIYQRQDTPRTTNKRFLQVVSTVQGNP